MNTIPRIVVKIGAIASGQLKRVYQGRSTLASLPEMHGDRLAPLREACPVGQYDWATVR